MNTKFPKLPSSHPPQNWARFFHAGTEWINAFEILRSATRDRGEESIWLPYVYSYALGFAAELMVKSIVSYEDRLFDPKSLRHHTTDIIQEFKNRIPILDKIANDTNLMCLFKVYEDTVDTKFGDTAISINDDDEKIFLDSIWEIRGEMCKRTGLR